MTTKEEKTSELDESTKRFCEKLKIQPIYNASVCLVSTDQGQMIFIMSTSGCLFVNNVKKISVTSIQEMRKYFSVGWEHNPEFSKKALDALKQLEVS